MALIKRSVWFFLIEVEVTGDSKQPWIKGSKALVQCFVPGTRLEDALLVLAEFLQTQELARLDVTRATRYDPDDEEEEYPGKYFQEPLEEAASRNECKLGVFIVSKDTSQWHQDESDLS